MELLALTLVIGAAAVHAGWNALAKQSRDKLAFLWTFNAAALVIYAVPFAIMVARHPPNWEGMPFLAGSGLTHVAYFGLLARAYTRTDLSLAYPVARGTGLFLVPILAMPLFGDRPTVVGWAGIALIVLGILWLHAPGLAAIRRRTGLREVVSGWALLTGLTIAGYSLIDAGGVKRLHPAVYIYLLFALITLLMAPYMLTRRGAAVRRELVERPWSVVGAAAGAFGTYLVVLAALRLAPVAYVVPVREVSIVFGALLGTRFLGEPFGRSRLVACVVVVIGVLAIAVGG